MKVLIADDDRISRTLLAETVRGSGHEVHPVADGREALRVLESEVDIDLAILDWTMPHLDGPEVCVRVRSRKRDRYLYLILVSARSKPEFVLEGLEAGADDYVAKPFSVVEIVARVRAAERVLAFQREAAMFRAYLDEIIVNLDCGVMLSNASGRVLFANEAMARLADVPETHVQGRMRDEILALHAREAVDPTAFLGPMLSVSAEPITVQAELRERDLKVVEWSSKTVSVAHAPARLDICRDATSKVAWSRKLERLALHDHLTGLLNRRGGDDVLTREVARATRYNSPLSFLMVDIDHFKRVNDQHGHAAGDRVLAEVARCIAKQLRAYDHAVRWGGEEMLVVLPETTAFDATRVAERVRASVEALDVEPRVTVSVGVAQLEGTLQASLAAADDALYAAKNAGRNRVRRVGEELPTLPPNTPLYSNPPP